MIIAGLTGGIASGKSTVAAFLAEAGAFIIDADQIARQVVEPGLPAWQDICDTFGKAILTADDHIDRDKLGQIVFENKHLRQKLEAIIHPRVGQQIDDQLSQISQNHPDAVVIMDIPLLFETGRREGLAEIIVVYTTDALQKARLMQRNGLTDHEAQVRIDSQMPLAEKAKMGTLTIDNSGAIEATKMQTLDIFQKLKTRAAATLKY